MFHQRISRLALGVLTCAGLVGFANPAMAANLTVDNTHSSSVSASTDSNGPASTPITGQGTFMANSGDGDPDVSSTTAVITDAGNTLTLKQALIETDFSSSSPIVESGSEDLFFRVATNTAFNMTGSYTVNAVLPTVSHDTPGPPPSTGQFSDSLFDVTTSTFVFDEIALSQPEGTAMTLGPETGTLNAGDLYEFQASASISTDLSEQPFVDPGGTGSVGLAMTPGISPIGGSVPLPAGVWTGTITLVAASIATKKLAPKS